MLLVQGNTLILAPLSVHLSRVRFVIVYLIYHSQTVTIISTVLLAYVGLLWTPPLSTAKAKAALVSLELIMTVPV